MRLNLRTVVEYARYYLRLYWWWMSSGSLLRFAIGYGAPIAVLVLAVQFIRSDPAPQDLSALNAGRGVTAEVAGAVASPQATAQMSTAPVNTPTVAASVLTYVVKSGDSLGAICSAHVPTMAINACVAAIVELNKLSGPDQLSVGQTLTLPAAGGSASRAAQPVSATTPGANASTSTPRPTSTIAGAASSGIATATPRPAATSATGQQQPGRITIDSLSSPIKPGQTATLKATAGANASCSVSYAAPEGSPEPGVGQIGRAADGAGNISWTWDIAKNTKKGKGLVVVTCGGTSISAYIEIN